jgi:ankyrin repeat protein/Tfp pilus assembly protein PilF
MMNFRLIAVAIVIALSTICSLCQAADFDTVFQHGAQAYSEGRTDEALEAFRQAAKIDPSNGPIHANIAMILYQYGKFDEALQEYQESVRLKPDFANGFRSMAFLLDRMGRKEDAAKAYERVLILMPKNATVMIWRAVILRQLGRLDEAMAAVRGALDINDKFAYAWASSGIIQMRKNLREAASADFGKARELNSAWLADAARCGDDEMIRASLAYGANVNAQEKDGTTPLMAAIVNDRASTVETLLALGADVNARTSDGTTALFLASGRGQTDMVNMLLSKSANVMAKRNNGGTALFSAASRGHVKTMQTLIEKGADVQARDVNGATALMVAAERGHTGAVQILLAAGSNVNTAADSMGNTALMVACYSGRTETAGVLLEAGAAVNVRNSKGLTSLMMAASKGHSGTVRLLIARGADVSMQSDSGLTAAGLAGRRGDEETFSILKKAGATETFDFTKKEAFVFGRLIFIEDGKEVGSYSLFDTPAPELYNADSGKTMNRVQLAGLFKEAFREDGSFCWKVPRGSYMFNRINRFGAPREDHFVYPQTAFFVPYGEDAYYLGTLIIRIAVKRNFIGEKSIDKVLSVEVVDESDRSKKLLAAVMPDFSGTTATSLMIHNTTLPKTVRTSSSDNEKLLQILNVFALPLMMIK